MALLLISETFNVFFAQCTRLDDAISKSIHYLELSAQRRHRVKRNFRSLHSAGSRPLLANASC